VRIGAPILKAGALLAETADVNNGLVTRDLFARGSVTAGRLGIAYGEQLVDINAGDGVPTFAAQNGSLYLRGNGQPYLRTNGAWVAWTGGGGGGAASAWATNGVVLYDVDKNAWNVAIGTNSADARLQVTSFSGNNDAPGQLLLDNGYVDADDPDPSIARACGLSLRNRHPGSQPWQIKTLFDDLRLTRYTATHDFLTIDASGNVGVTNNLAVHADLKSDSLKPVSGFRVLGIGTDGIINWFSDSTVGVSAGNFLGPDGSWHGLAVTNGNSYAATVSNQFRVDITHAFVASNATPNRVAVFDAANQLTNVFASTAPINGDGTRTTFAQINTLGSGDILTNGESLVTAFSNTLSVDALHNFWGSNNVFALGALMVGTNNTSGSNGFGVASPSKTLLFGIATNDNKITSYVPHTFRDVVTNSATVYAANGVILANPAAGAIGSSSGASADPYGYLSGLDCTGAIECSFANNDIGSVSKSWRRIYVNNGITNGTSANQSGFSMGTASLGTSMNGARGLISGTETTLTESTATAILTCVLANGKYAGFKIFATTHADDATDFQSVADNLIVSAVNKGGTVTLAVSTVAPTATAVSAGTLTTTWTATASGTTISIKNNAVSSLTQTTLKCKWRVEVDTDDTALTISPQ